MQAPLFYNLWFGKAVGFVGAFVIAPDDPAYLSLGIITGVGLGHLFDRWAATQDRGATRYRVPDAARAEAQDTATDLPAAFAFLFAALGQIAKRSGVVTREHIRCTERLIDQLGLSGARRRGAIAYFDQGKQNRYSFARVAPDLLARPRIGELKIFMLQAMVDTAAIAPSDAALSACVHLAQQLKIPGNVVAEEFSRALAARFPKARPRSGAQTDASTPTERPPELIAAYDVLEVAPQASAAEVKRAYRRLVSRHHPDKLARGATPRQVEAAQRKMVALRDALETIQAAQSA